MKRKLFILPIVLLLLIVTWNNAFAEKAKIVVLTDIGGSEPDDQQSLIRLLLYSDQFQILGLIGTNSRFGLSRGDITVISEIIDGYDQVLPNLLVHSSDYPSASYLKSVIREGQRTYLGMEGVGAGHNTSGSIYIEELLLSSVNDPIWFLAWGGTNTLAQALWSLQNKGLSSNQLENILKKVKVYDIAGQDNSGDWIASTFKGVTYIRSESQFAAFSRRSDWALSHPSQQGNISVADRTWFQNNIIYSHGSYGLMYPLASYMYEGDTPSFLFLLNNGLSDKNFVHYGSWGGRFTKTLNNNMHTDAIDLVRYGGTDHETVYTPLWRWREQYQNDFAARMDRTLTADFSGVNHNPSVIVNGDNSAEVMYLRMPLGSTTVLSAEESYDQDSDGLNFNWWVYSEPTTYVNTIAISQNTSSSINFTMPIDAQIEDSIHLILSVTDNGTPALTSYKRVVLIASPINSANIPHQDILILGNSITNGIEGFNSFRRPLWHRLNDVGLNFDFIGTMNTVYNNLPHPNPDFDLDHEGHYGWTADQLGAYLPAWLRDYTPDIVLLMIGSNDIYRGDQPSQVVSEIGVLIDQLRADNPNVTVLLGSLIPTIDPSRIAGSLELSSLLPAFAASKSTANSLVQFVDQTVNMSTSDLYDLVHPNETGEVKIAENWYNGLMEFLTTRYSDSLATPTNLQYSIGSDASIILQWEDNELFEESYLVEKSSNGSAYVQLASLPANSTSFIDNNNVTEGNQYAYRISAISSTAQSNYLYSGMVNATAPPAPYAVYVKDIQYEQVTVSWLDESSTSSQYNVYVCDGEGNNCQLTSTLQIGQNQTTIQGLQPMSNYSIRLSSSNAFGESNLSNEVSFQTLDPSVVTIFEINLDMNGDNTPAGWNKVVDNTSPGVMLQTMQTVNGEILPINLNLFNQLSGSNSRGATTGYDSGIFPDAVLITNFYQSSSNEIKFSFSGLDVSLDYTLTIVGSRSGDGDRTSIYSAGGTSISLNASNNVNSAAVFENLKADDSGELFFTMQKVSGASYGYIAGVKLVAKRYGANEIIPTPVENLSAEVTSTSVFLDWTYTNVATEEFLIQKSLNGLSYQTVAIVPFEQTYFQDNMLNSNTRYYYRIIAQNQYGNSSPVDIDATTSSQVSSAFSIYINMGQATNDSLWNNTVSYQNVICPILYDENRKLTGVNLSITSGAVGLNTAGAITGDNSGVYIDEVILGYFYTNSVMRPLRFSNLSNLYTYSLTFFGSRESDELRNTIYSSQGDTVVLNAQNNSSETVTLSNLVPDANGNIDFFFGSAPEMSYGYLNAVVLHAYPQGNEPITQSCYSYFQDQMPELTRVTFEASCSESSTDDPIVSYLWNFGDGTTASGSSLIKDYLEAGVYNVELTVQTENGIQSVYSEVVEVEILADVLACFSYVQTSEINQATVAFDASCSQPISGSSLDMFTWDFGDGTSSTEVYPVKVYNVAGTYNVSLTVRDALGYENVYTETVSTQVIDGAVSCFVYNQTSIVGQSNIQFNSTCSEPSTGSSINSYSWDFGDGTSSSEVNPLKSYNLPGVYNVKLVVSDLSGYSNSSEQQINVLVSEAAQACFTTQLSGNGGTVLFYSDCSAPSTGSQIVSYSWSFGDGNTSALQNPTHSYQASGTYSVTLEIVDAAGERSVYSNQIDITFQNVPIACYSYATNVGFSTSVDFNASCSITPNVSGVMYNWDFGDGNVGEGESITHIYSNSGDYTVTLTTIDQSTGLYSNSTQVLRVRTIKPVVSCFDVELNEFSFQVIYSAGCSYSANSFVVNYKWDFGDGTVQETDAPVVVHNYSTSGIYNVSLIVEDALGNLDTLLLSLNLVFLELTADFNFVLKDQISNTVAFDASNSTVPQGKMVEYIWDFGDGNTARGELVEHTFYNSYLHEVQLIVRDEYGVADTVKMTINLSSLDADTQNDIVTVYPTVVNDVLFVDANGLHGEAVIYNALGRVVFLSEVQNNGIQSINVKSLLSGIYTLHLLFDSNSTSFKILKL